MQSAVIKHFYRIILLSLLLLLSACSNTHTQQSTSLSERLSNQQTISQRNQQMQRLLHWRIKGKIAFIEKNKIGKNKRKSASLRWNYQANIRAKKLNTFFQQQIDLTTFMGINILHVESNGQQHNIKVDGKKYQGRNLNSMIYNLTGLHLPTQALPYWLKGIAYNKQDKIIYDEVTNLPKSLNSTFVKPSIQTLANKSFVQQQLMQQKPISNQTWQVSYSQYKNFSGHQLATRMTITHQDLTIKIAINTWSLL